MSTFQIALIISALLGLWLAICYLDNKYGLNLLAWVNGECDNPFQGSQKPSASVLDLSEKEKEIAELKERIQVLERVVTEPAYELNQKINALSKA